MLGERPGPAPQNPPMLTAKNELLAALAAELEVLSPGAGAKAAFESPKVAAHGDFACTAAMQLAKPLKLNPRALGEQLKAALEATPAFTRWVDAIEIAGPGFLNIRLKPAAKQEVVREVLAAGERFGYQPDNGQRVLVEFVSANPTRPLPVGHGRQAALGDAICNLFSTQGWKVHREFYYNDAGVQIDTLTKSTQLRAKGFKPGDDCWPTDSDNPLSKNFDYGDDKDRVMRKQDGTYTYFVPDVAYHIAKWERGFTKVVNIQGTDHHGTIARVRAGLQAADVGIPQGYPDYVLHTMVRVVKGGEEVKISKRAGSYVTLRDLIEWTSKDAVRFFLLSRKPDTEYTFDVDLAAAQNNDNPVYYVQYAHARIQSVLRAWQEAGGGNMASLHDVDLSALEGPQAQALMLQLAKYPEMLTAAADGEAPHDVTFYLRDLAASYHSYYDAERILVDDEAVKKARLALVAATAQVLHNGLAVLGVSAPARM